MADYDESKSAPAAPDYDTKKFAPVTSPARVLTSEPTGDPRIMNAPMPAPKDIGMMPKFTPAEVAKKGAELGVEALAPQNETDAAIMALSSILPFADKIAPMLEDSYPAAAKALKYLGEKGIGPIAARIGVTAGAGAAGGAMGGAPLAGAEQGATVGAAGEAIAPLGRVATGLGTAEAAATQATREEMANDLAERATQQRLEMTTAGAKELAQPISPATGAQETAALKRGVGAAKEQLFRETGLQYDPIYQPIEKLPVDTQVTRSASEAAYGARDLLKTRGQLSELSPKANRYLGELEQWAPPRVGASAKRIASAEIELPGGETTPVGELTKGTSFVDIGPRGKPLPARVIGGPKTLGELRGRLAEGMDIMASSGSRIERKAIFDATRPMADALADAIPDEAKPELQRVNAEYAGLIHRFQPTAENTLRKASTLPEVGAAIFDKMKPDATAQLLQNMNPSERSLAREAFASWALSEPEKTAKRLAENPQTLEQLGFEGDFAKIKTWQDLVTGQHQMQTPPKGLLQQREFERGVRTIMARNQFSEKARLAASETLMKSAHGIRGMGRWLLIYAPVEALMGFGPYHHAPGLAIGAAGYLASHLGFQAIVDNPAMRDAYMNFIRNGWSRAGGEAFGRLMIAAGNNALRIAPGTQPTASANTQPPRSGKVDASADARQWILQNRPKLDPAMANNPRQTTEYAIADGIRRGDTERAQDAFHEGVAKGILHPEASAKQIARIVRDPVGTALEDTPPKFDLALWAQAKGTHDSATQDKAEAALRRKFKAGAWKQLSPNDRMLFRPLLIKLLQKENERTVA